MLYNLKNKEEIDKFLEYAHKNIEAESMVELKKKLPPRTKKQNNYYWACLNEFFEQTGYKSTETHEVLLPKWFPDLLTYKKNGHKFRISTTTLDTKEMTELIERFRNRCAEEGFSIPNPDDFRNNYTYFMNRVEANKVYS